MELTTMYESLGVSRAVYEYGEKILAELKPRFEALDQTAEYNQTKVLAAMQKNKLSAGCFAATTGYGYDDMGREVLEKVYADCFGTEAALRISYFEGDETYIQTLFREAYYASPDTALDLPEAQVYIYPQGEESGRQRIVEVLLTYHLEQKELQRRRTALARRANEIVVSIWGTEGDEAIQTVSAAVLDAGHYDPEGGASAYDALVAGAADSEGLSLAALLLAQRLELTGMVVPGTLDGSPHFWNVVRTESGYRHLDLTRGADSRGQYPLLSDREMAALGYQWDTQAVPPCGEPSDSQEGTEEVPGTSSASSDGAE